MLSCKRSIDRSSRRAYWYFIDYGGKKAHKIVSFFMGLANNFKIALSCKHTVFGCFCLKDALKKLEFIENKELLKKVAINI